MENLVMCLIGLVGFLAIFFANCQMLKWASQVSKGGGGRSGIEREEQIVESIRFSGIFLQNSQLFFVLHGSALLLSNFLW
jgi:hypothetical protein